MRNFLKMRKFLKNFIHFHENLVITLVDNLIWFIVIIFALFFYSLYPTIFLSSRNIIFIFYHSSGLGLLVLAESLCLLSGNFDLSISAIAGFSATVAAAVLGLWLPGTPWFVGLLIITFLGLVLGSINGFAIGYLKINPFLQTLAAMICLAGGGIAVYPSSIYRLPSQYLYLGGGSIWGLPISIVVFLFLFGVIYFLVNHTPFGTHILFTGDNLNATSVSGVNTRRVIFMVFLISGLLSSWAGLLLTGFVGASVPRMAEGMVFEAFAAAIIGGVSLRGGKGSIFGVLGGVILLGILTSGLNLSNVQAVYVKVFNGFLIIVAIFIDNLRGRIVKKLQIETV